MFVFLAVLVFLLVFVAKEEEFVNHVILDVLFLIHVDYVYAELIVAYYYIIAKYYFGAAFLPEFNFNGIGNLEPGQGYQVKINESGVLNFLSNDNSYKFSKIEVTNNILSHFQSAINTGSNMTISEQYIGNTQNKF